MANTHILEQVQPGVFRVVHHIPVPATNNGAGISWQVALINSGVGGTTILKDGDGTAGTISAVEKAQIIAGSIYELPMTEEGQTVASVPAMYARRVSEVLVTIQSRLAQFGRNI